MVSKPTLVNAIASPGVLIGVTSLAQDPERVGTAYDHPTVGNGGGDVPSLSGARVRARTETAVEPGHGGCSSVVALGDAAVQGPCDVSVETSHVTERSITLLRIRRSQGHEYPENDDTDCRH